MARRAAAEWRRTSVLGTMAFFVGILLAIICGGVYRNEGSIILTLVILGIIVGLFNITIKEMIPFLVAAVALVVVGGAAFAALDDVVDGMGRVVDAIVDYIAVFMAPAAIINAMRVVVAVARPG